MDEPRLALYRKYRSASFDAVIGQDHIVRTLTAALASGRTSHAYLFSGPRGVGKTSVARLLARALNCSGDPRPCGSCTSCLDTGSGSLDIIEIDGASNRGIDEIRDLREKVHLAPNGGRYKVYIIDEVHMLTDAAFNALLKTLEEPPAHAVFIMATTESHKLPATIVSRVQHFKFQAIADDKLIGQLAGIAAQEGITIDSAALELIAVQSAGGFRDAISLLDQLASSSGAAIDVTAVQSLLGLVDSTHVELLTTAILTHDAAGISRLIVQLSAAGLSSASLAGQLLRHWQQRLASSLALDSANPAEASRLVQAIQAVLVMPKSSWPWLSLEAALLSTMLIPQAAAAVPPPTPQAASAAGPAPGQSAVAAKPSTPHNADLWTKALVQVKTHNNSLFALLKSCSVELDGDRATITTRFNFHRDRLEEPKNRTIIEKCLDKAYGRKLRLIIQVDASRAEPKAPPESELVTSALEILGGEVVYE